MCIIIYPLELELDELEDEELDEDDDDEELDELDTLREYDEALVELDDRLEDDELTPPANTINGDCVCVPYFGVIGETSMGTPSVRRINLKPISSLSNRTASDTSTIRSRSAMRYAFGSTSTTSPVTPQWGLCSEKK